MPYLHPRFTTATKRNCLSRGSLAIRQFSSKNLPWHKNNLFIIQFFGRVQTEDSQTSTGKRERELVKCGCRKGCHGNCSCFKAALKCTALVLGVEHVNRPLNIENCVYITAYLFIVKTEQGKHGKNNLKRINECEMFNFWFTNFYFVKYVIMNGKCFLTYLFVSNTHRIKLNS